MYGHDKSPYDRGSESIIQSDKPPQKTRSTTSSYMSEGNFLWLKTEGSNFEFRWSVLRFIFNMFKSWYLLC